jgi:hypothetical protein
MITANERPTEFTVPTQLDVAGASARRISVGMWTGGGVQGAELVGGA